MRLLVFSLLFGVICVAAEKPVLTIERMVLAQSEDGTPLPADTEFRPGDIIFVSFRVDGYTRKGDDPPKAFLSYEINVRDADNIALVPPESGKVAADLSAEDREWKPKIRYTLTLPGVLPTGKYSISVLVRDEFAKSEAKRESTFLVRGRDVAPSDTLVVRNFRFLRSEDDADALKIAAYRPGDAVWARFDMTGYKLGEGNRFDVEYGLKVLRPNGDVTYAQSRAAEESTSSFYPQRFTGGVLSLNLPKDLKTGQYTVIVTVRDRLGNQTAETRQTFDVE